MNTAWSYLAGDGSDRGWAERAARVWREAAGEELALDPAAVDLPLRPGAGRETTAQLAVSEGQILEPMSPQSWPPTPSPARRAHMAYADDGAFVVPSPPYS